MGAGIPLLENKKDVLMVFTFALFIYCYLLLLIFDFNRFLYLSFLNLICVYLYIIKAGALGQKLCGFGAAGVPKWSQKKGAERDGKGGPSGLQNGPV